MYYRHATCGLNALVERIPYRACSMTMVAEGKTAFASNILKPVLMMHGIGQLWLDSLG